VEKDFVPVRIYDSLQALVDAVAVSNRNIFPVLDAKKRFQGYVDMASIRQDMFRTDLYETAKVYNYMRSAPEYVHPDESMDSVMRKFEKTGAWNLPVVDDERRYIGFVSKSKIFNAYREELRDFSQD
jgi:CIC family chloride channel protein